jgi:AraC-like DNA-binding protein
VIHPGQRCTTLAGDELALTMDLGLRTWGNSPTGTTMLLTGTYDANSEVSKRLLDALPTVVVLPADEWDSPLVGLLAQDIVRDDPGQEAVLDRVLDLLLIAAVRTWFAQHTAHAPTWWRADGDPIVGKALRLLYNNPSRPWTIASLASAVGVSRAALARRFNGLVGEPPISFLTSWRLALAADLLRQPDITIGAVARQVGYGSPYALSTAFKRAYGISPHRHRLTNIQSHATA